MTGTLTITLPQPWATLTALGVIRILTTPNPAPAGAVGERLLIHASAKPLRTGGVHVPELKRDGTHAERDAVNRETWLAINTITDPAFQGPRPQGSRVPKRAQTPTLMWPHAGPWYEPGVDKSEYPRSEYLPLGAIVASCMLAACVPMVDGPMPTTSELPPRLVVLEDALWLLHHPEMVATNVEEQRPYGDFTPGRWAWILEDVRTVTARCPVCWGEGHREPVMPGGPDECDYCCGDGCAPVPIPAKGHAGLWRWTP